MTEEEKKAYEILYEKIIFVDKYRMLKPHWIKFHNYIEKLQKENEEYKLLNANIEKANRIIEGKEDYISKDKIREKIEFYKRYGKIKDSDEYVMSVEIEVLEELLEEE